MEVTAGLFVNRWMLSTQNPGGKDGRYATGLMWILVVAFPVIFYED